MRNVREDEAEKENIRDEKENAKSTRDTRFLLKEIERRTRRFKFENKLNIINVLVIVLLIDFVAVALREIRKYQKFVDLLISKLSMQRLMKEIVVIFSSNIRFKRIAIEALQEATEEMLIN